MKEIYFIVLKQQYQYGSKIPKCIRSIHMNSLANQLSTLLKNNKLKPTQLAKATGIAQPIIHRLITGKTTNPQLTTLLTIADYFNIELDHLIGRKALHSTSSTSTSPQLTLSTTPLISFEWLREDPARTENAIKNALPSSAFAIRIEDERFAPFAHTGFYVIIDPGTQHKNLDYVLVQHAKHNTLSLRQYIIDGNNHYLRPIPTQLPSRMLTKADKIFGAITHVIHCRNLELHKQNRTE